VAEVTGVSERTIKIILKEQEEHEEQGTSFGTTGKNHSVHKRIPEADNYDKCVVRHSNHNFYAQDGTVPTIVKLLVRLKERIDFRESCSSLRIIGRNLGFR
jgi:hypothetical protein